MASKLLRRADTAGRAGRRAAYRAPRAMSKPPGDTLVSGGSRLVFKYWQLTKPKVVAVIVFTAIVGMFLATPRIPRLDLVLFASTGIWLAASSAAALNHVLDRRVDAVMARTRRRPLPRGQLSATQALTFAGSLGLLSMLILALWVNWLTALLTLASLVGYSVLYTVWLKHATPQNIVIGGAAGAAPPVLGWAAVTNSVDPNALLLFLIVFTWTPPHFWALAIARRAEYANAQVPMLPVTHGIGFTCTYILLYTMLLALITTLPYFTGMSGLPYVVGALTLNVLFGQKVLALNAWPTVAAAMRAFRYSINYLLLLFTLLLIDHYCRAF
jgi:heme o synthase